MTAIPAIAEVFDGFIEDVDLFGTTFGSYARRLAAEVVSIGGGGSVADMTSTAGGPGSRRKACLHTAFYLERDGFRQPGESASVAAGSMAPFG